MAEINLGAYADQAAQAVTDYRAGTNPHWNDSYLNMGAQLMQQAMENDYALKLWNMNNEYNSPASQMARFKEAGLNPNLIYQQGTPGNSGSPAQASHANYSVQPHADLNTKIKNISDVINMVTNLAGNVSQMVSQGYDTGLKRNELAWSNTELAAANRFISGFGKRNSTPYYRVVSVTGPDGTEQPHFPETLNPFSDNFSPLEYNTLYRLGKIPNFFTGQLTGQASARLNQFRGDFQQQYNEHLLPLFEQYQQGKVSIQSVQQQMLDYQMQALQSLPPEVRGVMMPVMMLLNMLVKAL